MSKIISLVEEDPKGGLIRVRLMTQSSPSPIPSKLGVRKCVTPSAVIFGKVMARPPYGCITSGMKCWPHKCLAGLLCSGADQDADHISYQIVRQSGTQIRLHTEQSKPHCLTALSRLLLKLGTLSVIRAVHSQDIYSLHLVSAV